MMLADRYPVALARSSGCSLITKTPEFITLLLNTREGRMLFEGGYTYSNFLAHIVAIFLFVVWFWLLIVVFGDLFRRQDISGWVKRSG